MSQAPTPMPPLPDYYEILQVHPKASPAVIKKAYRTLLMEMGNHPDLGGDPAVAARITEAYQVLGDPVRRAEYDEAYFGFAPPPADRPERAAPPRPAARETNLVVLCPRCQTKNRVRSQEVLDIAKCSKCGQKLSAMPSAAAEWAERLRHQATRVRADVKAAWTEHQLRQAKTRTRPVTGNRAAWAAERVLSVGVPLLLLAAAGCGAWWALSGDKLGSDPVKTAQELQERDQPELAKQVLHRAVERGDTDPRIHELLGKTYMAQKDFKSASYHFAQAAGRNPDNAFLLSQLGHALLKEGNADRSEAALRQSLQQDPDQIESLTDLAVILVARQRYVEAEAYLERAIHLRPSAELYYDLGVAYKQGERPAKAIAAFRSALREDPNHRASMVQLGEILANAGKLKQAAALYMTASQIRHEDLDLHLRLATIYEKVGEPKLAIKEWRLCLAQGRANPLVTERAMRALNKLGASPEG